MKQKLDDSRVCEMGYCANDVAISLYGDIPCCDYCYGMATAEDMWSFLVYGDPPNGFVLPEWKPLDSRQAMTIIYVIQEFLGALPDTWDMCSNCERFFCTENEYYIADEKLGILCENCCYLCDKKENGE